MGIKRCLITGGVCFEGGFKMAECLKCEGCNEYINLEIDIVRDDNGRIYCLYCGSLIKQE